MGESDWINYEKMDPKASEYIGMKTKLRGNIFKMGETIGELHKQVLRGLLGKEEPLLPLLFWGSFDVERIDGKKRLVATRYIAFDKIEDRFSGEKVEIYLKFVYRFDEITEIVELEGIFAKVLRGGKK